MLIGMPVHAPAQRPVAAPSSAPIFVVAEQPKMLNVHAPAVLAHVVHCQVARNGPVVYRPNDTMHEGDRPDLLVVPPDLRVPVARRRIGADVASSAWVENEASSCTFGYGLGDE